jgi:hypothetical protein
MKYCYSHALMSCSMRVGDYSKQTKMSKMQRHNLLKHSNQETERHKVNYCLTKTAHSRRQNSIITKSQTQNITCCMQPIISTIKQYVLLKKVLQNSSRKVLYNLCIIFSYPSLMLMSDAWHAA